MRISTKYTSDDWKGLTFQKEDEWLLAIDIFYERIKERFLDPIDCIEDHDYSGFAVIALDCLLIEMLEQFRVGIGRTPSGKSKEFFMNFLTETGLGVYFDHRKAQLFYRQIRCGILHQAELRGSSKILTDESLPLVEYSPDNRGLIVNRRRFHRTLMDVFEQYLTDLKNPENEELRRRFHRKMMAICKNACEVV